ncbi:uncharacterized protein LOC111625863 [Centruroides sculpturatus]|uniref:uncharacterized protein LOC111625863 n=1 Tax=Centruroides sculpturatus TaxID=218467 RepID=UPI000C6EB3A5|nr:uncharacterized protein LOC111625863 [Centruroides sculpturatus]
MWNKWKSILNTAKPLFFIGLQTNRYKTKLLRNLTISVSISGITWLYMNTHKAFMKESLHTNFNYFMAVPITDTKKLEQNKNDMKIKMELLILRIQVRYISEDR